MRLTGREGGGFRLTGAPAPIEGVPAAGALVVACGGRTWRFERDESGCGAVGGTIVITWRDDDPAAASSVLLEDGRLFRVSPRGLSEPSVEVLRWDGIGPYVVARADTGAWRVELTAAGESMSGVNELLIAACFEIGRRDGWW